VVWYQVSVEFDGHNLLEEAVPQEARKYPGIDAEEH
jgi:hypothetical protein